MVNSGRYGRATGTLDTVPETVFGMQSRHCRQPAGAACVARCIACLRPIGAVQAGSAAVVVTEERERLLRLAGPIPATCPRHLLRRCSPHCRDAPFAGDGMDGFFNAGRRDGYPLLYRRRGSGGTTRPSAKCVAEFSAASSLPRGVFPVAGVTLGWPAWEGWTRLPPEVVVQRYDDARLEGAVDAYDARRREAAPIPPER